MIPRHRDQLKVLWTDERAAQLFVNASTGSAPVANAGAACSPATRRR